MSFKSKIKARTSTVEIEGETLTLKEPSYALSAEVGKASDPLTGMAKLFVACVFNADGTPVWADSEVEDIKGLPIGIVRQLDNALGELSRRDPKKA